MIDLTPYGDGFDDLIAHAGHHLVTEAVLRDGTNVVLSVSVVCKTCEELLIEFDNPAAWSPEEQAIRQTMRVHPLSEALKIIECELGRSAAARVTVAITEDMLEKTEQIKDAAERAQARSEGLATLRECMRQVQPTSEGQGAQEGTTDG